MKKLIVLIIALLAVSTQMSAQYARCGGRTGCDAYDVSVSSFNFENNDGLAANPDFSKGLSRKKAGTSLLITAGACTAAGAALYGSSWGFVSDSGSPAAAVLPITGVTLLAASVPLYIAGSVLYVKGKKATLEVVPGALAIRF